MRGDIALIALIIPFLTAVAAEAEGPAAVYLKEIKPLLRERCFACHGALKQESGLRLDTVASMRKGGDGGAVLVPRNIAESTLIERLTADIDAGRMPPEGEPLNPEQIARIRSWIAAGAIAPKDEEPDPDPESHWAFRPPTRPTPPQTADGEHPIDAFILARLDREKLAPRPLAVKATRLRRLYLDLVGVPPNRDELHAFLTDSSETAWVTVVDRLLADPRYGQRWARHWMDVWRYSDWYGRRHVPDVWNSAPQIWRWRDWIVESLNDDKGYDRMVAEMLAADEICPEDREAGYATGYLIRNWYALNPNDWMRANVEHTGKAFLGLTFNCAHCHDHKYDPITHDNYFQFRAFFEPIAVRQDRVPGEADPGPFQEYDYAKRRLIQRLGAVRIFDRDPDAPTWFYTGGDERNRREDRGSMKPRLPEFLASRPLNITPLDLPTPAWYPGLQPEIQQTVLDEASSALAEAESALNELPDVPAGASAEAEKELAAAETIYREAVKAARKSGRGGALSGQQSVVLDATQGRRILQNAGGVQRLTELPDGSRLEFEMQIVKDAHVNFQLARDIKAGLTALYLGFETGRILAYRPGGFTVFEAGRYDFAAGQRRFHVSLVLQTEADRCLATVRSVSDQKVLVESVPIALNGWNPVGDPTKAITFDARTGAVALFDDVTLTAPLADGAASDTDGEPLLSLDFEPPKFRHDHDVVGIEGFIASSRNVPPARSYVSATALNEELPPLRKRVESARRALRMLTLPRDSATAQVAAATAQVASVKARIAADNARYGVTRTDASDELARAANRAERKAKLLQAQADVLSNELALQQAQALPDDAKDRDKQIEKATTALSASRTRLAEAEAAKDTGEESTEYSAFSPTYPQTSTGRRKALAEWIIDRRNPLTARVAVNHIWTRHFHAPLVSTVYDFGRNGAEPTHPELLDWLAVELMESGWSMKHIHRLIVTSDAWQRVSSRGAATANHQADPGNRLLWRMNTGRMEAEALRDSLLHCAGKLDFTPGGQELENDQALTTFRRSLYYSVFPEKGGASMLGELFDAPNPLECYRRTESIVPQQALALTNSKLVHELSASIVANWQKSPPAAKGESPGAGDNERTFVTDMFERILARSPRGRELETCCEYLEKQRQQLASESASAPDTAARESLVRALFNHNDFVTIR